MLNHHCNTGNAIYCFLYWMLKLYLPNSPSLISRLKDICLCGMNHFSNVAVTHIVDSSIRVWNRDFKVRMRCKRITANEKYSH